MPNNDHLKSARQMIDDLINDNPEASKQSFHDFLKAKTISKLNPEMEYENDVEDEDVDMDDDVEVEDSSDDDVSVDDDESSDDNDDSETE